MQLQPSSRPSQGKGGLIKLRRNTPPTVLPQADSQKIGSLSSITSEEAPLGAMGMLYERQTSGSTVAGGVINSVTIEKFSDKNAVSMPSASERKGHMINSCCTGRVIENRWDTGIRQISTARKAIKWRNYREVVVRTSDAATKKFSQSTARSTSEVSMSGPTSPLS